MNNTTHKTHTPYEGRGDSRAQRAREKKESEYFRVWNIWNP